MYLKNEVYKNCKKILLLKIFFKLIVEKFTQSFIVSTTLNSNANFNFMKLNTQHIINATAIASIGERGLVGIAMLGVVFVPCLSVLADCARSLRHRWQAMMNRDAIRHNGTAAIIQGILGTKAALAVDSVNAPSVADYAGNNFVTFYVAGTDKQVKQ